MFRFTEERDHKNYTKTGRLDSIDEYWDTDYDLKDEGGWERRHEHEATILSHIITQLSISNVIELGSGPGNLGDKVVKQTNVSYTMIDGDSALRAHKRRGYAGNIIVQDLFDSFDTSKLEKDYDLVVANDFLEHIRNPSAILEGCREITKDASYFFLSSPNWRMKHNFFYPGLFDYNNLVKFMWQEGYELTNQFPSWAQHVAVKAPRLDSEDQVPEGHLLDWNYYLLFKKREE